MGDLLFIAVRYTLGPVDPIKHMNIFNTKAGPSLPALHISCDDMIGKSNKIYNEHRFIFNTKCIAKPLSPEKTSQIRR